MSRECEKITRVGMFLLPENRGAIKSRRIGKVRLGLDGCKDGSKNKLT